MNLEHLVACHIVARLAQLMLPATQLLNIPAVGELFSDENNVISVKGLKVNVLKQLEQDDNQRQRLAAVLVNQDSSSRSRAQSLNEEALRKYVIA
jgi:hypothetical protein